MLISDLDVSHGQILSNRASVRLESQGELTRVFLNLCKIIFVLFIILNYLFLYMSNELDYKFLHSFLVGLLWFPRKFNLFYWIRFASFPSSSTHSLILIFLEFKMAKMAARKRATCRQIKNDHCNNFHNRVVSFSYGHSNPHKINFIFPHIFFLRAQSQSKSRVSVVAASYKMAVAVTNDCNMFIFFYFFLTYISFAKHLLHIRGTHVWQRLINYGIHAH